MIRIADLPFVRWSGSRKRKLESKQRFIEVLENRLLFDAAPTATVLAPPELVGTNYVLRVRYADDTGINTGTIDPLDIFLNGPNGFSEFSNFHTTSQLGDGSIEVDYSFGRPFVAGAYTFDLREQQVADENGNFVPAGTLAQLQEEEIHDTTPPTATLSGAPFRNAAGTYFFEVTYSDNTALDNSSIINSQAVHVVGAHGYDQTAELAALLQRPDGSRVATYVIPAPKPGNYRIVMDANGPQDIFGNTVQAGELGVFKVNAGKKH